MADCNAALETDCIPKGTATCASLGGNCKSNCLSTEASPGKLDCPNTDPRCCVATGAKFKGGGGPDIVDCSGKKGIETAIGCIPLEDTNSFVKFLLGWGMGIGGGIAFLLIVLAGFQIITSSGDPKKLQAGKELLTSAIAGLLLIIFSVFILRLIGADILGIFKS